MGGVAKIIQKSQWGPWVTPRHLRDKPVHRWCVFPHSFTSELVHGLIEEWGLTEKDRILDPFCGAGTTPLAAKEKGIPATGYDLSPFAVFAAKVKLADYDPTGLAEAWEALQKRIDPAKWNGASRDYADLVKKALPGHLLGAFDSVAGQIARLKRSRSERDFFKMALLSTLPDFSRAVATGGWLSWKKRRRSVDRIPSQLAEHVVAMLKDVAATPVRHVGEKWIIRRADARKLPDDDETYSAVITSPPYPNRHDYTRVFGVELMFGFLDWSSTRRLRHQSFESHPEARPRRPDSSGYKEPTGLTKTLTKIKKMYPDPRIPEMLRGYFLDMYLTLRETFRVCQKGAHIAFVVGNAQYGGCPVKVDELTAQIGEQVGLTCEHIVAARYRGNSAQQMREHGRKPSRESIVVFKIPQSCQVNRKKDARAPSEEKSAAERREVGERSENEGRPDARRSSRGPFRTA